MSSTDWTLTYNLPPNTDGEKFAEDLLGYAENNGATQAVASPTDDSLVRELAAALRAVEWEYGEDDDADTLYCPWCDSRFNAEMPGKHKTNCPRQTALAKFDAIYGKDEADEAPAP